MYVQKKPDNFRLSETFDESRFGTSGKRKMGVVSIKLFGIAPFNRLQYTAMKMPSTFASASTKSTTIEVQKRLHNPDQSNEQAQNYNVSALNHLRRSGSSTHRYGAFHCAVPPTLVISFHQSAKEFF